MSAGAANWGPKKMSMTRMKWWGCILVFACGTAWSGDASAIRFFEKSGSGGQHDSSRRGFLKTTATVGGALAMTKLLTACGLAPKRLTPKQAETHLRKLLGDLPPGEEGTGPHPKFVFNRGQISAMIGKLFNGLPGKKHFGRSKKGIKTFSRTEVGGDPQVRAALLDVLLEHLGSSPEAAGAMGSLTHFRFVPPSFMPEDRPNYVKGGWTAHRSPGDLAAAALVDDLDRFGGQATEMAKQLLTYGFKAQDHMGLPDGTRGKRGNSQLLARDGLVARQVLDVMQGSRSYTWNQKATQAIQAHMPGHSTVVRALTDKRDAKPLGANWLSTEEHQQIHASLSIAANTLVERARQGDKAALAYINSPVVSPEDIKEVNALVASLPGFN